MQKDIYERIINFLLGASWAIIVFGALFTFKIFSSFGFLIALSLTLVFIIVSLFLILLLDALLVNKQKLQELQKQTHLLQAIFEDNLNKKKYNHKEYSRSN